MTGDGRRRLPRGRAMSGALIALLAGLAASAPVIAACVPDVVEVRAAGGAAAFRVEVADSAPARARGLMHRRTLAPDAGMLFIYDRPGRATFWMKDTLIPLDMIFADARGEVLHVHARARPLDTTPVDGGEGVKFVLEINAGLAERLGLGPGAELRHPAVDQEIAVWPCD